MNITHNKKDEVENKESMQTDENISEESAKEDAENILKNTDSDAEVKRSNNDVGIPWDFVMVLMDDDLLVSVGAAVAQFREFGDVRFLFSAADNLCIASNSTLYEIICDYEEFDAEEGFPNVSSSKLSFILDRLMHSILQLAYTKSQKPSDGRTLALDNLYLLVLHYIFNAVQASRDVERLDMTFLPLTSEN